VPIEVDEYTPFWVATAADDDKFEELVATADSE
jgi:hypothetical protein